MRDNGPVTQHEVFMADGSAIVSKTDDKGRLLFVNNDFVDISGFSREELIGQPHNMIRHRDMPPEAFKDLWADLQAGKPWSGYVKNRTKTGDHYWVLANAMPVMEGGRVTGYVSIRSKPDPATTKAVGEIYQKFIEGKQGSLKIEHGAVVDTSRKARFARWRGTFGGKIATLGGIMCLLLITVGGLGIYSLNDTSNMLKTVYEGRMVPVGHLADINHNQMDNLVVLTLYASGAITDPNVVADRVAKNRTNVVKMWDAYIANQLSPEEKALAAEYDEDKTNFFKNGVLPALAIIKSESSADLTAQLVLTEVLFKKADESNRKLIQFQLDVAKDTYGIAKRNFIVNSIIIIAGIVIALFLASMNAHRLKNMLVGKLAYVDSCLNSIAGGNYNTTVDISADELQSTLTVVRALQAKLQYGELEKKELEGEATKAKMKMADDFESRTAGIIKSLAAAATEMQATAAQMTAASGSTANASQIVAAAATEADSNVQTVAAATEELSASSSEIARQISSVAEKSTRASGEAVRTSEQVNELNSLADSIGEVISAIKDIAEQTNLLALNATIEAARAGEAGKGFAVVADEVKKLATETASKTVQIDERVGKIQSAIRSTVDAVGRIISDVRDIDHSTATVASAVEEQNAATAEIGRNVSEASTGTQQVAQNIVDVQRSAEETGEAANNLNQAANELAEISENLQEQVGVFLAEIRRG